MISKIIALSNPLLISWSKFPFLVLNIRIKVPISEAEASKLPLKFNEIKEISFLWALIKVVVWFS